MLGAWLAMLALAVQCLVIQPHVDVAQAPVATVVAHVSVQSTQPNHETQGVCVICQAMATAGAFALSASPTLTLIERNFVATTRIAYSAPIEPARSHNWQSRAPPPAI